MKWTEGLGVVSSIASITGISMLWFKERIGEAEVLQLLVNGLASVVATLLTLAVSLFFIWVVLWFDADWRKKRVWTIGRLVIGFTVSGISIAAASVCVFFIWHLAAVVWREAL